MKTKGINTSEQIDAMKRTVKDEQASEELCMKGMIISLFAYNSLNKETRFLQDYKKSLGEKLFNEVYEEQAKFLQENYDIEYHTYTDSEGCTYNSLIRK